MAAVEVQLATMGMRLLPVDKMEYGRNLAQLWAKDKQMLLNEVIAFALEET